MKLRTLTLAILVAGLAAAARAQLAAPNAAGVSMGHLHLIVRDPDAPGGTFIHWVVYNIPPTKRSLAKSYTQAERAPNGTLQGLNDFERIGYGGPCPPGSHHAHRYIFTLYALDTRLPDRPGYGAGELASTMDGHVLSQAALLGTYQRLF